MGDIDDIEDYRSANNVLWMDLLRLVLENEETKPKAKKILLKIKRNDAEVQRLLGQLASD